MKDTIIGKIVLSPKRCECNATSEDECACGLWDDEAALMREHIKKLERREDEHCRQIEELEKDNALLLEGVVDAKRFYDATNKLLVIDEAHIRPSWDEKCWTKIGRNHEFIKSYIYLQGSLKAAEAAMEGE